MQGVWVTNFSQSMDLMLLQEIFQTPFSNNSIKKYIYIPAGGTPETHILLKQVLVEYLQVWFR